MELRTHLDIGRCRDLPTFERSLVVFAHALGFGLANASVGVDVPGEPQRWRIVGNTPKAFVEAASDQAQSRRCPIMKLLKRTSTPFAYDQSFFIRGGEPEMWEDQASHGYKTGMAVAMHLPDHRHFLLGVDREESLPADVNELTSLFAALQLFAVHAQESAMGLFGFEASGRTAAIGERIDLTRREKECLQWAAEGKTVWETARILSISEGAVAKFVLAATRKLGCVSKSHALARSLRQGLIS